MSADRVDRTRVYTTRDTGGHLARDLEKYRQTVMRRPRNVGGSGRSESDRHDPSKTRPVSTEVMSRYGLKGV